jgi:hypothetical protein
MFLAWGEVTMPQQVAAYFWTFHLYLSEKKTLSGICFIYEIAPVWYFMIGNTGLE